MFGQRTISLVSVLILSSKALAQIPAAFTTGFNPANIMLEADFGGAVGRINDGEQLNTADAAAVPKFALGDSSSISSRAKYIILMIDPDSPEKDDDTSVQVLQYMKTDFAVTDGTSLGSTAAATVPYAGPGTSVGTGEHRYIFLLYDQPAGFANVGVPSASNRTFSVKAWKEANNLKPATAGIHFLATPGAGPSKAVESAASTPVATPVEYPSVVSTPMASAPMASPPMASPPADASVVSPPAAAVTHKVIVGGPGMLTYSPAFVQAAVGDVIEFDFLSKNHTVTQSTFEAPCVAKPAGVASGFRPNPDNISGKQMFTYTVCDATPKWFFCNQGTHCKSGMVFAVNPGTKFPAYLAKATGAAVSAAVSTAVAAPTTIELSASGPSSTSVSASASATASATDYPAAYPTGVQTPSPIVSAPTAAVTHKVIVGGPGMLTYSPAFVQAAAGDIVQFDILAKNHTVTQSTFNTPCVANPAGVTSGFRPNAQNIEGNQVFTYTVPDVTPKWFFCDQGTHCESGMVFAVNPGTKFPAYLALATGGTPAATGTGGLPIPTGNSSAPGVPDVQVFPGAASGRTTASWALVGAAGFLAFFL